MFHAYTGCDTVSYFATKGKKMGMNIWKASEDVIKTCLALSTGPTQLTDEDVVVVERRRFTVHLYDRTSSMVNIDEAPQELFTKKGQTMEAIPSTKAALVQHIKRIVYQGGHYWGRATEFAPELPSPEDWGWTDPPSWKPMWTTLLNHLEMQHITSIMSCT
jgi:hypothetical protein